MATEVFYDEEPLIDIHSIQNRQKIIGLMVESTSLRKNIRKILKAMGDLERLSGRAGTLLRSIILVLSVE